MRLRDIPVTGRAPVGRCVRIGRQTCTGHRDAPGEVSHAQRFHLSRRNAAVAGCTRDAAHRRTPRGGHGAQRPYRRRSGIHGARGDVIHCHRRRRRTAGLLVQGWAAGVRARARRAHARDTRLRRQRHVPYLGQCPGQPSGGSAVSRFREPKAHPRQRHRPGARGRSAALRVSWSRVRRARCRRADFPELSALRSQDEAARALGLRAAARIHAAGSSLEDIRSIPRCAPRARQKGGYMTIKLYSWPMSSGTRIAWALEELALPYQYVPLDAKKQEHRSPEMLAVNPHGKVPSLDDGGLKLFESGAILLYLGNRYGAAKGLWPGPKGQQALADAVCWTVWAMTEVGGYMMQYLYHGVDSPVS